jgi:hypothetical protein
MAIADWMGWVVYGVFALLFLSFLWLPIARLQSVLFRWGLMWTLIILLFFPWLSDELNGHFAPSTVVAAFALLDSGVTSALQVIQLQVLVWLGGLGIVVAIAAMSKLKKSH